MEQEFKFSEEYIQRKMNSFFDFIEFEDKILEKYE